MLTHEQLIQAMPGALSTVDLPGWGQKVSGKVRDIYTWQNNLVLITSDRVSAFDRVLGLIPHKGQVLNQLSAWWFEQTSDIVANHVIAVPDENVTVAHAAEPLPIEVVVRGYITGVTKTSLWHMYSQGERHPYGISLPDGMRKNDALPAPVITPTTKASAGSHDERITREEILARGIVPAALWLEVESVALRLFARGQELARKSGLILVDTKYEFGVLDGRLILIDEIHTPDSSRYWIADTYGPGREPANFDKEFLREWFAGQGYRGDGEPPIMPGEFIAQLAARYISAYERLTSLAFVPGQQPAVERIARNLASFQTSNKM